MPSQPNNSTKRRPVDVLFGEKDTHTSPNYAVEPPQPITTVSPPTPDDMIKPTLAPTPPPPVAPKPAPSFSPMNGKPQTINSVSIPAPAPTVAAVPASPPPMPHVAPAFDPEPVIAHPIVAPNQDQYIAATSARIEKLYELVKQRTQDSRIVAEQCLALLLQARQAYAARDYPNAEFHLQSVEARLQRSETSKQASRRVIVWVILLWGLITLAASGFAIAMSYVINLTLFGLPVLPEGIVLMRAIAWGALGGAFGALASLAGAIRHREYESSANLGYFARPIFGGILGAIFFLLSQAGIVGGNVVWNNVQLGPLFLYVFAVLVGFKQEAVTEMLGNLVKTVLGRK
jgi:hypothetical protein